MAVDQAGRAGTIETQPVPGRHLAVTKYSDLHGLLSFNIHDQPVEFTGCQAKFSCIRSLKNAACMGSPASWPGRHTAAFAR
jgi:hypothetical protein